MFKNSIYEKWGFAKIGNMSQKYPEDLTHLIAHLKKLPGVGSRTAERFAFELLSWPEEHLTLLGDLLKEILHKVPSCSECGCLKNGETCRFCSEERNTNSLCIISSARDAYSIEETRSYRGLYHVIEHLLSPLDGRHANQLRTDKIEERIAKHNITEVIIAFDSTLEGDTTALYLKQQLAKLPISLSRLAFGIPVGSSLEYIDSGTLARAFVGRQII